MKRTMAPLLAGAGMAITLAGCVAVPYGTPVYSGDSVYVTGAPAYDYAPGYYGPYYGSTFIGGYYHNWGDWGHPWGGRHGDGDWHGGRGGHGDGDWHGGRGGRGGGDWHGGRGGRGGGD